MAVRIKNLCKKYGDNKVLENFSADFPETGAVCIWGASGIGKTTLTNIIMGLEKPDSGEIEGIDPDRISCVFQEDRLLPWNTLYENASISVDPKECSGLCQKWIEAVELWEDRDKYPDELSGGMKRRCALARALIRAEHSRCEILIMDEPFKGLDADLKNRIISKITPLWEKMLAIIITHDREEAESITDKIISLEE